MGLEWRGRQAGKQLIVLVLNEGMPTASNNGWMISTH
jgi:hypothetical protein